MVAYLLVVPVEEGEEAGLGACGALYTAEAEVVSGSFDVPKIPEELLP